jgi:protein-disulfide isomerase
MANEKQTVKNETSSTLTPIIIIGGILLDTILGIYMISRSGGDQPDPKVADGNTPATKDMRIPNYDKAPAGATPANFKGSNSAPVVLEEFADFECPTCAVVHPKMSEIISKYGNRVKVIFRNYPLSQIHPKSYDASVAAEAAGLQGKYWEMQNMIFNNQNSWKVSQNHKKEFEGYAQKLGLDVDKFSSDMLGLPAKSRVDADINRGRALKITSTPSVLINGVQVPFSQMEVAGMSKLIDAELEKFQPKKDEETKSDEDKSDKKDDSADKEEKGEEKSEK